MSLWFEYAPITTIITGVVAVLLVLTILAIGRAPKYLILRTSIDAIGNSSGATDCAAVIPPEAA